MWAENGRTTLLLPTHLLLIFFQPRLCLWVDREGRKSWLRLCRLISRIIACIKQYFTAPQNILLKRRSRTHVKPITTVAVRAAYRWMWSWMSRWRRDSLYVILITLQTNINGLLFSASSAITVNHTDQADFFVAWCLAPQDENACHTWAP